MLRTQIAIVVTALSLVEASHASQPEARAPHQPTISRTWTAIALQAGAPRVAKELSFGNLLPIQITYPNSGRSVSVRLYDEVGRIDEQAATGLDALLCDAKDSDDDRAKTLDRRLLQIVFRAAYHFSTDKVLVVSACRKPTRKPEGAHAQGRAIDFKLGGVASPILAAYLRTIPRVGVGIYTHPKTQFVHLDVREHSFHWMDASPPGRHWRERNISSKTLNVLDSHYSRQDDWPEGFSPPEKIGG